MHHIRPSSAVSLKDLPSPSILKRGWPWDVEIDPLPRNMPNGQPWPRVTLIIPSFNQGKYIEETLRSILLQGYPDLECIVMDGGSTDSTTDIVKKYEEWIHYWVSEPDRGQSHAINKGLVIGTGKYFNWNNADDVLNKDSLRECVIALEENPTAAGVTGYIVNIDEKSNFLSSNDNHPLLKGKTGFLHDVSRCISLLKCGCQPGGLMDLELAREVGGVDEDIHYAMDTDLQLRMMLHRPFYHIDFPVIMFRLHSLSKTSSYVGNRAIERIRIAKKIFSQRHLMPMEIAKLESTALHTAYAHASSIFASQGRYLHALPCLAMKLFYAFRNRVNSDRTSENRNVHQQ